MFTGNKNNVVIDYYAERFLEFLSPDSAAYTSEMNPVFSFELELKPVEKKIFSLRDGVFSLMRFFALNKSPLENSPQFIVDSRLSALVPESWRSKVLLRAPYVIKQAQVKKLNKVYIFISPDKKSLPPDLLEMELQKINSSLSETEELIILFSSLRMRGEGAAFSDQAYGYKVLLQLMTFFKGRKIDIINYEQFLNADLDGVKFHFVNQLLFHFTDSNLFHESAKRGAQPLIDLYQKIETDNTYILSKNHGFSIHQNFDPYIGSEYDEIQRALFHSPSVNIHDRIYQKALVDWSYDVARELHRMSAKNVSKPT